MLHKQNQQQAGGHPSTEVKKPLVSSTRRVDHKEKPQFSPLNDPLVEVVNGNVTPQRSFLTGGEGTRVARNQQPSSITHVSAFDRMYVGTMETTKNDMILNIVPKDPHLSNLAQTLERQARQYQQKQLIESFPLRYNDLLNKEQQLAELLAKHTALGQQTEELKQEYRKLEDLLADMEVEQSDKEQKLQRVLEEAELERQRMLEAVRSEHELNLKAVEQQRKQERLRADIAEEDKRLVTQELEEVVEDRRQKEEQIEALTEALRETKTQSDRAAIELTIQLEAFEKQQQQHSSLLADLNSQLTRVREELTMATKDRQAQNQSLQSMAFEKGTLAERLQRAEQQRLEFKVQWQQLRLDSNQQKTIISELSEQLQGATQKLENHSFVVAQLQGEITLKQVELGDKTADLITLKERLLELESEVGNLEQKNEILNKQKTDIHVGATESQQQLKVKLTTQQEMILQLQDQVEFTRKENGYLLAIREELEAENDELRRTSAKHHQQLEVTNYERQSLEKRVIQLREMLKAAIDSNEEELQTLKLEVARHLESEQQSSKQAEDKYKRALSRTVQLEDECSKLKAALERHIKALASKQLEHDKVVTKLIEVSNSRTVLVDKENSVLLEEANKKLAENAVALSDKDEQIRALQTLLRETRSTILGLSESLKERTARQKQLFDEVLAEKRRMKKQIEALEAELRQFRRQ